VHEGAPKARSVVRRQKDVNVEPLEGLCPGCDISVTAGAVDDSRIRFCADGRVFGCTVSLEGPRQKEKGGG
jgi:hypothetical protein